ncbi:MAG TPA: hypothetical protein VD978_37225 [Azospirillum sp.]|nr:hypothetical protein [Azospirillum sp.]
MLTYEDCIGLADLEKDEVAQIAEHEKLPYMTALEKGAALLTEPWGDAAIRQMVWDNLCKASQRQRTDRIEELAVLYRMTCERHPSLCDRRQSPVRPTHPIWRHH